MLFKREIVQKKTYKRVVLCSTGFYVDVQPIKYALLLTRL